MLRIFADLEDVSGSNFRIGGLKFMNQCRHELGSGHGARKRSALPGPLRPETVLVPCFCSGVQSLSGILSDRVCGREPIGNLLQCREAVQKRASGPAGDQPRQSSVTGARSCQSLSISLVST